MGGLPFGSKLSMIWDRLRPTVSSYGFRIRSFILNVYVINGLVRALWSALRTPINARTCARVTVRMVLYLRSHDDCGEALEAAILASNLRLLTYASHHGLCGNCCSGHVNYASTSAHSHGAALLDVLGWHRAEEVYQQRHSGVYLCGPGVYLCGPGT